MLLNPANPFMNGLYKHSHITALLLLLHLFIYIYIVKGGLSIENRKLIKSISSPYKHCKKLFI